MNNLRRIRNQSNLLMKDVYARTGISVSVLNKLEMGLREFKQSHIESLTSFFNITSDFLLGKTDYGINMIAEDGDLVVFNKAQFLKFIGKFDQRIDKCIGTIKTIDSSGKEISKTCPYYIVREISDPSLLESTTNLKEKAERCLDRMTDEQLEKTIKFMEDFILK